MIPDLQGKQPKQTSPLWPPLAPQFSPSPSWLAGLQAADANPAHAFKIFVLFHKRPLNVLLDVVLELFLFLPYKAFQLPYISSVQRALLAVAWRGAVMNYRQGAEPPIEALAAPPFPCRPPKPRSCRGVANHDLVSNICAFVEQIWVLFPADFKSALPSSFSCFARCSFSSSVPLCRSFLICGSS